MLKPWAMRLTTPSAKTRSSSPGNARAHASVPNLRVSSHAAALSAPAAMVAGTLRGWGNGVSSGRSGRRGEIEAMTFLGSGDGGWSGLQRSAVGALRGAVGADV